MIRKKLCRACAAAAATVLAAVTAIPAVPALAGETEPEITVLAEDAASAPDITAVQETVPGEFIAVYTTERAATRAGKVLEKNIPGVDSAEKIEGSSAVVITMDDTESAEDGMEILSHDSMVEYVQPNYVYRLLDSYAGTENASIGTNDPYGIFEYALTQTGIKAAWDAVKSHDHSEVTVAVIDSGINASHADLGNINYAKSVDVTKPKVNGQWQACTSDVDSNFRHGTHVISNIAATAGNSTGLAGMATCGLTDTDGYLDAFMVNAFEWSSSYNGVLASTDDLVQAIYYAKDNGADIINMSLGLVTDSTTWEDSLFSQAIEDAYDDGIICVCAAGNDNSDHSVYPSDDEHVISVTSLSTMEYSNGTINEFSRDSFRKSSFSNYGTVKDIAAPGEYMIGCSGGTDGYALLSGTSQATPVVASVVALMLMADDTLTFSEVYSVLTDNADDITYPIEGGSEYAGFDIYTGYGMVNASACLNEVLGSGCTTHTPVRVPASAATCTREGNTEYYTCSACGKHFSDAACTDELEEGEWVIPKTAHNVTYTAGWEATCRRQGSTGYYTCSSCGKYFSDEACTEELEENGWVIPKKAHTPVYHEAEAATCEEAGHLAYWQCSVCSLCSDTEDFETEYTISEIPEIPATGIHTCTEFYGFNCTWGRSEEYGVLVPVSAKAGYTCSTCSYRDWTADATVTLTEKVLPTCIEDGHLTYTVSHGGNSQEYNVVLECRGHIGTPVETESKALCSEMWYSGETVCPTCGIIIQEGHWNSAVPLSTYFYDTSDSSWYAEAVGAIYDRGIMTGLGNSKAADGRYAFSPTGTLTREQFATILYRLEGSPDVGYRDIFPDVPDGSWITDPIMWAYESGVITGYQNGYFGVGDPITREQLAVMLYRYAGWKGYDVSARNTASGLRSYADWDSISSWAEEALNWCTAVGIITGKTGTGRKLVDPQGTATRCECATMVWRYLCFEDSGNASTGIPDSVQHVHEYDYDNIEFSEPTCDTPGYLLLRCSCGKTVMQVLDDAEGHSWRPVTNYYRNVYETHYYCDKCGMDITTDADWEIHKATGCTCISGTSDWVKSGISFVGNSVDLIKCPRGYNEENNEATGLYYCCKCGKVITEQEYLEETGR